jgi:predicted negative regulator of RcsB-dependent stress response
MSKSNRGFAHLALILAVILVALAGLVGWRVYQSQHKTDTSVSNSASTNQDSLSAASQAVDNEDVNTDLNSASLDSDINSLL